MRNIKKPEIILITGGSGMVGKAIKNCYVNKINKKIIKDKIILSPSRQELDLRDYEKVDKWFIENKPEIVILAAAKVGGILANTNEPASFILENLRVQTNLIEISQKHEVKKFLFLGSSCIYPKFAKQPISEDCLLSGSLEKTNQFYAIAKISGIKLCEALTLQKGFNAISLMPTNLYGPGDNYNVLNSHVLPSFIRRFSEAKKNKSKNIICWGSGKPLREFLYVNDLAEACLFILENWSPDFMNSLKDKNGNRLYWLNIGSDFEISIKNLAEMISELVCFEGEIIWDENKPDGTPRKKLDTTRLKNLGWSAKTNLKEGIKLTLRHYEQEIKNNSIRY